jgi:hypothetical protein
VQAVSQTQGTPADNRDDDTLVPNDVSAFARKIGRGGDSNFVNVVRYLRSGRAGIDDYWRKLRSSMPHKLTIQQRKRVNNNCQEACVPLPSASLCRVLCSHRLAGVATLFDSRSKDSAEFLILSNSKCSFVGSIKSHAVPFQHDVLLDE